MKAKCILTLILILAMVCTACSSDSENNTQPEETTVEQEPQKEEAAKTEAKTTETQVNNTESAKPETAEEETPIIPDHNCFVGTVEEYTDDTITITNPDDGMLLYFSTKSAQITEGDSPIAVGDTVIITYQGLMGDETNPTEAVKIEAAN